MTTSEGKGSSRRRWLVPVLGALVAVTATVSPERALAADNEVTGVPESGAECKFNDHGDFQCKIVDSDTGCVFVYFGYEDGGGSARICDA